MDLPAHAPPLSARGVTLPHGGGHPSLGKAARLCRPARAPAAESQAWEKLCLPLPVPRPCPIPQLIKPQLPGCCSILSCCSHLPASLLSLPHPPPNPISTLISTPHPALHPPLHPTPPHTHSAPLHSPSFPPLHGGLHLLGICNECGDRIGHPVLRTPLPGLLRPGSGLPGDSLWRKGREGGVDRVMDEDGVTKVDFCSAQTHTHTHTGFLYLTQHTCKRVPTVFLYLALVDLQC